MGEADSRYKSLPIVALTANAVSGMKEMFLEEGFSDFLAKPIDSVKLNTILEKWIPRHKQKSAGVGEVIANIRPPGANPEINGLNVPMGIQMSGGNEVLYFETLAIFCEDGLERIDMIRECLEKRDLKLYTTCIHALKSASAIVGADKLSEAAYELEMAGLRDDLPYIEANNKMFVADLKGLILSISAMLSRDAGFDEALGAPGAQAKAGLVRLKTALLDLNVGEIDRAADSLSTSARSIEEHSAVKKISNHILMGEYEEAIELIDELIEFYTATNLQEKVADNSQQ